MLQASRMQVLVIDDCESGLAKWASGFNLCPMLNAFKAEAAARKHCCKYNNVNNVNQVHGQDMPHT